MINKKAQVADTVTWLFATIVIISLLLISIFIVSFSRNNKTFNVPHFKDPVVAKSLSAFLLTEDKSGEMIFDAISKEGDLDDFSGKLSVKVLRDFYESTYPSSIVLRGGISDMKFDSSTSVKNKYWGFPLPDCLGIEERIYFSEDKYLRLCLKE